MAIRRSPRIIELGAALFAFIGHEVIRARAIFFGSTLLGLATVGVIFALRGSEGLSEGFGVIFMLGLWVLAAPLCRTWLDEDVRLGHGALWLQKPNPAYLFHLARTLALLAWCSLAGLSAATALTPAVLLGGLSPSEVPSLLLGVGWMPALLVLLSQLGGGLGARNGALFAYGMLFAGLALPGLADAVSLGVAQRLLNVVLPPALAGLEALGALRAAGLVAGLAELWDLALYLSAVGVLGLGLSMRTPGRLGRGV